MNVVVTTPVWTLNGVNVFCAELVRGLRARGIGARLLVTGVSYTDSKPLEPPDDVELQQLPLPRFATWNARRRALAEFLESTSPCIYLPNHDFNHSSISATLSPRVGVVGIVHSDDEQHYDHATRLAGYWNATVAVSSTIAARTKQRTSIDPARLGVIPYGVRLRPVRTRSQAAAKLRILYTGRLEQPQKRVHDLLEIANVLRNRRVPFRLTIIGGGPEQRRLAKRVDDYELNDFVSLVRTQPHSRIRDACDDHHVYLLTSAYEGTPLSLLEAMASGCVPVVSDVESGIRDLVRDGENGFRVPVGNVSEFADRLELLSMSADLIATLGAAARRAIGDGGFTVEHMTARYAAVCERVWREVRLESFMRKRASYEVLPKLRWIDRLRAPVWPLVQRLPTARPPR